LLCSSGEVGPAPAVDRFLGLAPGLWFTIPASVVVGSGS
jgi:hypothetical protein